MAQNHDPSAEWDTCVIEKGVHTCWRRHPHDTRGHGCSCGFEWDRSEDDPW